MSFSASARFDGHLLTSSSLGPAMPVAELPFDVVEAKLAAPLTRPGTVAKADVIARLCASPSPFATVVAPAGYGKTTLLASWAEADSRPFAWVAFDGRADDALVFLRYIAAAIHRVESVPREVLDALSGLPGRARVVTQLRLEGELSAVAAWQNVRGTIQMVHTVRCVQIPGRCDEP